MDAMDASVAMLVFIGACDGNICEKEVATLEDFASRFIKSGASQSDMTRAMENALLALKNNTFQQYVEQALNFFKNNTDDSTRLSMLDFMFIMIASDGRMDNNEAEAHYHICEYWGFDPQSYATRLKQMWK